MKPAIAILLAALGSAIATRAACSKPQFASARLFLAGQTVLFAAAGDFNGDGFPDVAVVNTSSGNVSVFLGNGDGTLQPAVNYATGSFPTSVVAADFNGDGVPDLAVSNDGAGFPSTEVKHIAILLGAGDGTFKTGAIIANVSGRLVTGDFNGDGKVDLAVPTAIVSGNGDGTFKAPVLLSVIGIGAPLAAGDFDGDGKFDLAAVSQEPATLNSTVIVLLGNGSNTFKTPVPYVVGKNPDFIVAADLNQDGKPDLVTANFDGGGISVLLGTGAGAFQAAVTYATGANPTSVSVRDFNGDGFADLVVSNGSADPNASSMAILLNKGDGTFAAAAKFFPSVGDIFALTSDWNADGVPDLLVLTADAFANVAVVLGNGDGTFQTGPRYAAGRTPAAMTMGDFNGDGAQDLAVSNNGSNDVSVLIGNGDGTFQAPVNYPVNAKGTGVNNVVTADFNGDGALDLAVAIGPTFNVAILLGNGDGTFKPASNVQLLLGAGYVAAGDFNGDNKPDLAVIGLLGVVMLLGRGDGTFTTGSTYTVDAGLGTIAVADFDGDGKPDMAVSNFGTNYVSILMGNGDGTFKAKVDYAAGVGVVSVAGADFNGDGKPDLVVANFGCTVCGDPKTVGGVAMLLGNGDGTFQSAVNYPSIKAPQLVTVGDFNGDGAADAAVASTFPSAVSVLLGNGDGTLQAPAGFGVGSSPAAVVAADLNGDGKLDLAAANASFNNVSVLLNTCPAN